MQKENKIPASRLWRRIREGIADIDMRQRNLALLLGLALLLSGCGRSAAEAVVETADPYAGMVLVESGYGTQMWVTKYENVPVNTLTPEDFTDGVYNGAEYIARRGVDVNIAGEITSFSIASRWLILLCTLPSDSRPMKCIAPPEAFTPAASFCQVSEA